jgi:hypothetical protein
MSKERAPQLLDCADLAQVKERGEGRNKTKKE